MSWKRVTIGESPMSRHATDFQGPPQEQERPPQEQEQERAPSPPLPADHVLSSGAVLFPGAFDQHGCPLVMFPVDGQDKLTSELSKAEVMHFINYFQYQHRKKQEKQSLVSVVADLRDASLSTITFIVETLLLLELRKRTVHTAYILQPKKKDVDKQLLKLLAPSKRHVSFTRVLLKEIPELQNYIDRSQLPWPLGGYLLYRHQSWVAFVKEMDVFAQEFVSVVQRLPSCISTLQALSRLPLPSTFSELQHFCSTTDAKFQQLRRELGLEELLRKCESLVEKLRCPDRERCYQDMAGTALFTQTAFDMLQNHSRITAAVDKVELLWQQLFSKARLQLHVFQLRDDALQITEKIEDLLQEKIQPYKVEIAKDATTAVTLVSEFEASVHAPAMVLVRWAEDVIQTSAEVLPSAGRHAERWAADLQRLKEKLGSAVNFILRTLRAVSSYHRSYSKAGRWYRLVLCQNFLQELLSGVHGDAASIRPQQKSWETIPAWRYRLSTFLKKNPPPDVEVLLYLAHLANAIPDDEIQQAGRQMSQRCRVLRELLTSSGPVAVRRLQLALQWQYELLRSNQVAQSAAAYTSKSVQHGPSDSNLTKCEGGEEAARFFGASSSTAVSGVASAGGKPPSFSSFDSGFDGAVNSPLEALGGRERLAGTRDFEEPVVSPPQSHEFTSSVSDCGDQREDSDSGPLGNSSKAASLHLEIKVKRSAALSNNPWLSLPVDDLEKSYAVSSTQNASDPRLTANQTGGSRDRPDVLSSPEPKGPQSGDWTLHSQSGVEHPELSPMCNILSSTVIEGGDESISPTEGVPTLLWDSYDLHDQNPDHRETEISVKDWALREQEGLREVEKTLDKASEILEEEENVLAQEAVLDALLRPEDGQDVWRLCDSEDQRDAMSSYELSKAGVLGFEDFVDSAESDGVGELTSAESAGESKRELYREAAAASEVSNSRPDLLTELTEVHILDELIMEENLKIHELRCSKESPNAEFPESKPADVNVPLSKEALWLQQAREERGAETLESSWEEGCEVKKGEDHAEEVVKCSVTGKPRNETEDGVLRDFFPNGSGGSESGPSTDESLSTSTTKTIEAISDLKEPSEEAGVQSHQYSYGKELDRSGEHAFLCGPEASLTPEIGPGDGAFDPGGKSLLRPVSEPSVSSRPENELRTPRSTEVLKSALSLTDQHFVQLNRQDDLLEELPQKVSPHSSHHSVPDPNVMEHGNSNHALAEVSRASLQLPSETLTNEDQMPTCSVQLDLQPAGEIHAPADERQLQSGSQLTPDQPLEFDPGGRNGPNEKLPDGVQSCGALRTSYSGSPGSQTRFHSHVREIGDLRSPIVLDTGSGLMKAGFADQHLPNIIFPTIIGVPKYEEILNGSLEREAYIGHDAQHMRGVLTLKHPIKNGIIHNWDEMEKIWHHTFQQLRVEPEDHPVLLTEAAMNPLKNREHTVEIMFECFNVPFTYVAMQAVLALYAAGRTTGVVFDSGAGVSHSVPVFEGYALPHAVQRFPLAGSDVTMHLQKLLQEQGVCMRTTAEEEIVREMKEQCCCVALNYEEELSQGGSSCREMHYTMPDGQIITLSTERFRAPEILFKPELIGRDHYGMHESVFKSVLSADIDLRRCLLGNIVLSGGNTLLPGLPERLQAEIKGLLPADVGQRVCVTSPKDRDFSVWSGGAVLASLPTFTSAWVSREEYEEYGPQIVFRKCF